MKTRFLLSASAAFLFLFSNAQQYSHDSEKKNILKTNLTAYAFRNYNLTYERAITKWFSVNVSYGMMPAGKLPFSNLFLKDEESSEFRDIEVSASQITIEPRFYLGNRGYGRGFYLAPYYRHSEFTLDNAVYEFTPDVSLRDIPIRISGRTTANSFGLMIGCQWFLGKRDNWVLDFWIVGGHYGTANGDFDGVSDYVMTPEEQRELKEYLENQDIPVVEYSVNTNSRGASIKMNGPWAGLRSGLSFGYRF